MTREEAIEVYNGLINTKIKEAFEFFAPELRESEDERIRKWLVNYFTESGENWIHREFTCKQIVAYLEKQKEQKPDDDPLNDPKFLKGFDTGREVQRIFDEKKPAEWSEEDKNRIQRICDFLWKNRKGDTDTIYQIEKDADWLESLRPDSYKNCNSRWKPSEEQMSALLNAERLIRPYYPEHAKILAELYEQLKAL